jgi:hypothetical protein
MSSDTQMQYGDLRAFEEAMSLAERYSSEPGCTTLARVALQARRMPLSKARAAEFRGRRLKHLFGDRESRARRFERLRSTLGLATAMRLSSRASMTHDEFTLER